MRSSTATGARGQRPFRRETRRVEDGKKHPSTSAAGKPATRSEKVVYLGREDYEAASPILRDAVLKLWDVVEDLTLLRPIRSLTYQATIFGSARIQSGTPHYQAVRRLAFNLAEMGASVVTGGGPGLMQAANEGALAGAPDHPERSIGIRIDLEFEQEVNAFVGQVYKHKTFFSRLHHFILRSNVFVVVPGGIGTLLELAMVWQLLQVRKLYDTPLILVGPMWSELVSWANRWMIEGETRLASPIDMSIPRCVDTVDEAVELIRPHYEAWQRDGQDGVNGVGSR